MTLDSLYHSLLSAQLSAQQEQSQQVQLHLQTVLTIMREEMSREMQRMEERLDAQVGYQHMPVPLGWIVKHFSCMRPLMQISYHRDRAICVCFDAWLNQCLTSR